MANLVVSLPSIEAIWFVRRLPPQLVSAMSRSQAKSARVGEPKGCASEREALVRAHRFRECEDAWSGELGSARAELGFTWPALVQEMVNNERDTSSLLCDPPSGDYVLAAELAKSNTFLVGS